MLINDPHSRSLHRKVLVAGAWVVGLKGVSVLLTLVFNVLVARRLNLADVGMFLMITSAAYVAATIATLGVNSALLRSLAADNLTSHLVGMTSAWRTVGLASLVAGAVTGVGAAVTLSGEASQHIGVSITCAILVVAQALTLLLADCFRGIHDVRLAGLFDGTQGGLLPIAASTAVLLLLPSNPFNSLPAILGLTSVVSVLNLLVGLALFGIRWSRRRTQSITRPNAPELRTARMILHSLPFLGTSLFLLLRTQVALWIVGGFGSAADAAIFGVAQRVMNAVMLPSMVMTNALQPTIAQLVATSRRDILESLLRRTATLTALPVAAAVLVASAAGGTLLSLLFGPQYAAGGAAIQILALGNLAFVALGSPGLVLGMSGLQRTNMTIYGATVLLTAAVGIPATRLFGITGMSWAVAVIGVLNKAASIAVVRRTHGIWTHATLDILPAGLRPVTQPQEG
jgi:O-antigen/teichoic acid export membrane protein